MNKDESIWTLMNKDPEELMRIFGELKYESICTLTVDGPWEKLEQLYNLANDLGLEPNIGKALV